MKHLKKLWTSLLGAVFIVVLCLGHVSFVHASCSTNAGDSTCVAQDCADAQNAATTKGTDFIAKCQNAINACDATYGVGTPLTGGMAIYDANQGNCANALSSCFQHETDQTACTDGDVLAIASQCNNGNVDSAGTGNCGMDNAIGLHNSIDGGTDYTNNAGIEQGRLNDQLKECDNSTNYPDTTSRTNCQNDIKNQVNQCYSDNGGSTGRFDNTQYNYCIASKANSKPECIARQGNWNDSTNTCTPATTTPPSAACPNGGAVDATTGKCPDGSTPSVAAASGATTTSFQNCGQAQTNLISCKDSGVGAIGDVLKFAIDALTVLVGVGAVAGIAWEALQYARAQDDSGIVSTARTRIRDIIIGLGVYIFMIAIINWLVPGGIIGGS